MEVLDDLEEFVDIVRQDGFGSLRCHAGKWRLVNAAWVNGSGWGGLVDQYLHETDLVGAVTLVVEELGEYLLGGGAVDACRRPSWLSRVWSQT